MLNWNTVGLVLNNPVNFVQKQEKKTTVHKCVISVSK